MKATEKDDHDEWAEEVVRKIAEAERMGGGFRLHFEAAADQIASVRRDRNQLIAACLRLARETDWCPFCEHHPSSGHHESCVVAKDRTS